MLRILGIETSCDETAIGVVEDGVKIRSNIIASSQAFHTQYGGVVPEIAARVHVEVIWQVLEDALKTAECQLSDIDAIAVTQGPGLPGALLIGVAFAKGLALAMDRPLVPVDHLAAHLYAAQMTDTTLEPPYIGLIVSGGHTMLCVAHAEQRYELLGETKDDAVGEAFDKVAKLLGLGYPGGPLIDRLSDEGRRDAVAFPRATAKQGFDFSFSGLKTAVYQHVHEQIKVSGAPAAARGSEGQALDRGNIADIAASFQETAVDILVGKTLRACQRTGIRQIVIGGGVAANRRLRQRLADEAQAHQLRLVVPPIALCLDNGAMVAGIGAELLRRGRHAPLSMTIDPGLHLTN